MALAALLALGYFWPHIYWIVRGTACGEAFYAGKPTSYWRGVAEDASCEPSPAPASGGPAVPVAAPELGWRGKFDAWKRAWLNNSVVRWQELQNDPAAVPVLRELFHDGDEDIRAKAVTALCEHPASIRGDLPELVDYLRAAGGTKDVYPKLKIISVLRKIAGEQALPVLCDCLNDPDDAAANVARAVILCYESDAEQAMPFLVRNLGSAHGGRSAQVIAEMRVADRRTILPVLAKAFQSENAVVRRNAVRGIAMKACYWGGDATAMAVLMEGAKDSDAEVRCIVVDALGFAPSNLDAVCTVIRAYNDDHDPKVQAAALVSLDKSRWCSMACTLTSEDSLKSWIKAAEENNHADLYFEAARALDKYIRSVPAAPPPAPVERRQP